MRPHPVRSTRKKQEHNSRTPVFERYREMVTRKVLGRNISEGQQGVVRELSTRKWIWTSNPLATRNFFIHNRVIRILLEEKDRLSKIAKPTPQEMEAIQKNDAILQTIFGPTPHFFLESTSRKNKYVIAYLPEGTTHAAIRRALIRFLIETEEHRNRRYERSSRETKY